MVLFYSVKTLPLSFGVYYMSHHLHRYEALMLTVPEITADEAKSIEQQFNRLVADKKGSMVSFERWGKYRLAYPVKKNDYGVYFLARFETAQSEPLVDEVKTLLAVKLHEIIMRSMLTKLEEKQSLEYQRPPSLEEAPARSEGSPFAKDGRNDNHADHDSDQEL